MKPLDRILAATSLRDDADAAALRKAAVLAAEHGAALTLLHVVEPRASRFARLHAPAASEQAAGIAGAPEHAPERATASDAADAPLDFGHAARMHERITRARRELVRRCGEIAAKQGVPADFRIETGEIVQCILAACGDADALVIGATRRGLLSSALRRSTAQRLTGRCPVPMMVVKSTRSLQYARCLVPVDASFHRVEPLRAAARLMPRARITVLHALDMRREQLMRITETPPRAVRLRREHMSAKVLGWMQGLVARAGLDPAAVVCRVAYGDAWSSTLALQEELAADALVLMKRPVHGFTDFVWGSTVRRLLALAECDVLVVQPDSPVWAAQNAVRSRRERGGIPETAHAAQALPAGPVDESA